MGSTLYWHPEICSAIAESPSAIQIPLLAIGVGILSVVVLFQWWTISNLWRVNSIPLSEVEKMHPRLPGVLEVIITMLLSIVLVTFFTQFSSADPSGIFSLSSSTTQTNDSRQIVMADFDRDGDVDYVVRNHGQNDALYLNSGTGAFTLHSTFNDGGSHTVAAGDMNRDGYTDLVYATDADFFFVRNQYASGGSGFTITGCAPSCPTTDQLYTDVELGDLDNDGDLDAVFGQITQTNTMVALNTGTGILRLVNSTFAPSNKVLLADINHDNVLDLALVTTAGGLNLYRGTGTGGFAVFSTKAGLGQTTTVLAMGDLNDDGYLDFIGSDSLQRLSIVFGTSDGRLPVGRSTISTTMANIKAVAVGDIDNDGDLDILAAGNASGGVNGGVNYFINDGAGTFSFEELGTEGSDNSDDLALADIDNDADLDYIRVNRGAVANRHYVSNVSGTSANATPSAPSSLSVTAQFPYVGTGTAITTDSGTGTLDWSNAAQIGKEDGSYATTVSPMSSGTQSYYLKMTDLAFRVATGATIEGIKVDVRRLASGNSSIYDGAVRLIKGGTIQTHDKASATFWSTSIETASYGGSSDLWGTTWTPSQINSSGFGVALSAKSSSGASVSPSVDAVSITIYTDQATVTLTWGSGSDTESATSTLQYNIRAGTGSAAENIISGQVQSPTYATRLLGNPSVRQYILHDLACGQAYTWSVATVDTGLRKSSFASENSFNLTDDCEIESSSGGGSSGGSSTAGGGWSWNVIRPKKGKWDIVPEEEKLDESASDSTNARVIVQAFFDANRNGVRDFGERLGFAGHTVTIADANGKKLTGKIGAKGELVFSMPEEEKGYAISIDPEAANGYKYFVTSDTSDVVVSSGEERVVGLGLTYTEIIQYLPCLKIRTGTTNLGASDAFAFLNKLDDIYGNTVLAGIQTNETLVSRRSFFTLLSRTQCVKQLTESEAAKKTSVRFSDLPITPYGPEQKIMYSLLATGIPVSASASSNVIDANAPVKRRDAILALNAALGLPKDDIDTSKYPLPVDLDAGSEIGMAYIRLDMLGVLPQSFRTIFGSERGMTMSEMATLIARTAFILGRVSLVDDAQFGNDEVSVSTFLSSTVPTLHAQPCIQKNLPRMDQFTFSDVLPGHPFYEPLRSLMQYRVENTEAQKLHLVTGTQKLTEFGVERGTSVMDLSGPVSAIETLRTLLVLTCRPPVAKAILDRGQRDVIAGSLQQFAKDQLFGLPPSSALPSRIALRAQRSETFGNFSLFSLAPKLLREEKRSPYTPFSLEDGGELLASVLLMTAAEQGIITPQEAQNMVADAKERILSDLTSQAGITRVEARLVPLTRGQLLYFASVFADRRLVASADELSSFTSLSEQWFARIMR